MSDWKFGAVEPSGCWVDGHSGPFVKSLSFTLWLEPGNVLTELKKTSQGDFLIEGGNICNIRKRCFGKAKEIFE